MSITAKHIDISGLVQGVGFRPFIYRHAKQHDLTGWVRNYTGGVEIHLEGNKADYHKFIDTLRNKAPRASQISKIKENPTDTYHYSSFTIQPSLNGSQKITNISPDIAVCEDCLEDIKKQPRRFRYPFTNCTHCGPRFSIVKDLPYDRKHTTMKDFEMCPDCREEYENVTDRRFHAQPVSCRKCGPIFELIGNKNSLEKKLEYNFDSNLPDSWQLTVGNMQEEYLFANCQLPIANLKKPSTKNTHLLNKLAQSITSGKILALKSIGGFQLIADATNEATIRRLRKIKQRHSKPFAVMFKDLETVKQFARVSNAEAKALQSWRRPIVILREKKSLSKEVNRDFPTLGVVLPYSPLHYLMMEALDTPAIVFTSANLKGQPLISENEKARQLLENNFCDAVLQHNREISHRLDDSIVRIINGKPALIRRARGFVPEPIQMKANVEGVLAMGADLKNSFCTGKDRRAIMSQYVGDLENFDVFHLYQNSIHEFLRLFRVKPEIIACDTHPDYHSSKYAVRLIRKDTNLNGKKPQLVCVQHHHAHIASVMAEHHLDEKVIGVAMDGTGYGDDGKIWGSEFFVNGLESYERHYHLAYLPLPGGEKAIKEPWRVATAVLYQIFGREFLQFPQNRDMAKKDQLSVIKAVQKNLNIHKSCGMGRLFDVAAALLNLLHTSHFDGEGPIKLENITTSAEQSYPFRLENATFNYEPIIRSMVDELRANAPKGTIAARFHNTIIEMIEYGVKKISASEGIKKVALSGGIFQNKYITEKLTARLIKNGMTVYTNEKVPANDGGIALGQMVIADKKKQLCV
ncbi:MAG: carbamoyltransferase HypF [Bacteroidales bacterium]|nr:carbamoyltransferase HypF [Bacteroidales bacterium]MCF8336346.1 carbamoyltransferase HypF [Bacteroidales bacterium]